MRYRVFSAGMLGMCLVLCLSRAEAQTYGPEISPAPLAGVVSGSGLTQALAPGQEGRIHWGKLSLYPQLSVYAGYDDNIFLGNGSDSLAVINTPSGQKLVYDEQRIGDGIFQFVPGLALKYPLPKSRGSVGVGYLGDFALYAMHPENNWMRQIVSLDFVYDVPMGIYFSLQDGFLFTSDPFGDQAQYDIGIKKKRWNNEIKPTLGYAFNRWFRLFLYYTYFIQGYLDKVRDFSQDYFIQEVGPSFQVRVLPKTWAFVAYQFRLQDYYTDEGNVTKLNNANSNTNQFTLGLTWDATAKITGILAFGWEWVTFDNAVDPGGLPYENTNLPYVNTSLNYRLTPRTRLSLFISNYFTSSGANTNQDFITTAVGIGCMHAFFTKFTARGGIAYSHNGYNTPDLIFPDPYLHPTWANMGQDSRSDNNINFAAGLTYQWRAWLGFGFDYTLYWKGSNYTQYGYTENVATVFVKGSY